MSIPLRCLAVLSAGLLLFPAAAVADEPPLPTSPHDIRPLLIGTEVPDVPVLDLDGNEVSLAGLVREQPTVLIFYRGGW
jgi:hypothetical protein